MNVLAASSGRQATVNSYPLLAALLIAIGAVMSLIAIISIYREGGILNVFALRRCLP